jgi:type IV pilus assembly protein PilW
MAGYRGCVSDNNQFKNSLNQADDYLYNFSLPIQGHEAASDQWLPELPSYLDAVLPGTDVLTIRTTLGSPVYISRSMPEASADLKIEKNLDPPPFATAGGDVVVVSNCGGASVFQITQYTVASGNVVHNTGASRIPPGNATKDLGRRYSEGSQVFKIATISYFIRNSSKGTGPALWQQTGGLQPAKELVEGIENMQLLYGEDADGDRAPDTYRKASDVEDWNRITTVRVALLAASPEDVLAQPNPDTFTLLDTVVGPFNDRRLRRAITFTVSLRGRPP